MLGRLNNCKYFSSLDLCLGYYHISYTEEAKKKTAFVTVDGKYQWNIVLSETYEEHLHHLCSIFEKFKEAGLKTKLSKCQFFKTHLHKLGHKISADGLEPLPEKLEAIKNLAPTKNMDEAHQILGLLGYYRSFVPAFTDMTSPITSLLKKNTSVVWSEKCRLTLHYLKQFF